MKIEVTQSMPNTKDTKFYDHRNNFEIVTQQANNNHHNMTKSNEFYAIKLTSIRSEYFRNISTM